MPYVELLLLAEDGLDGREEGVILDIRDQAEIEAIPWPVPRNHPERFRILRIEDMTKDGLPDDWKQFGGHRSKIVIDKAKVEKKVKDDWEATKGERKIAHAIVKMNKAEQYKTDKGDGWSPKPEGATVIGELL